MTCPNCGTTIQPHDLFCMSCGHALTPADPTRHLDTPVEAVYGDTPVEAAYGAAAPDQGYGSPPTNQPAWQAQPSQPPTPPAFVRPLQTPAYAPPADRSGDGRKWASGSSFPAANPYASTPNTVSSGTILNGRPVGSR